MVDPHLGVGSVDAHLERCRPAKWRPARGPGVVHARGVVHDQAVSTPDQDDGTTLASYEAGVDRYLEHSSPPGPEMVRYLDRYADLVGSGRVLELGSGPGWDALHLEARGVHLTRSDATHAFLTRPRAAGHDALHLDVRTDDLGGPWDGLLADAVLLHLDGAQLEELLHRARRAVTTDGVLGFTLKEATGRLGPPTSSTIPGTSPTGASPPCARSSPAPGGRCGTCTTSPVDTNYGSTSAPSPPGCGESPDRNAIGGAHGSQSRSPIVFCNWPRRMTRAGWPG